MFPYHVIEVNILAGLITPMNRRKFVKVSSLSLGGLAVAGIGVDISGISAKENYYLQGNYAPVNNLISETGLKVTGQIPKDLSGLFVRNGPNPMSSVNIIGKK